MRGVVKFFNDEKGFGFIKVDDGGQYDEYFFHATSVQGLPLRDGDQVEFDPTRSDKGLRAQSVRKA